MISFIHDFIIHDFIHHILFLVKNSQRIITLTIERLKQIGTPKSKAECLTLAGNLGWLFSQLINSSVQVTAIKQFFKVFCFILFC